jgi:tetratricopeptide (TPR) repeat protein
MLKYSGVLVMCLWGVSLYAQGSEAELKKMDSLGQIHWKKAAYSRALFYYKKAILIAENRQDIKSQARILTAMGVVCENKGDFETSLKYHFRGLRLKERIDDIQELARSYINIGIAYCSSGEIEKGLSYYLKAIQTSKGRYQLAETHAFYHISTAYRHLKKYEQATEYAQKALALAHKIKENVVAIDAQNGLGLIATEQGEYAKGRTYYQKVYELASQAQDWLIITNTLQHLAENYEKEKQYFKAIEYTQQSLTLAQKHELKAEEQLAYNLLASLHHRQGQFELAYQYQKKGFALKDSLFNLQKSQQIAELTIEYETEKKAQQILLLEKDKRISQNTIWGLVLIVLLLFMVVVFILYRHQAQQALQKEQKNTLKAELASNKMENKLAQERLEEQIAHQERELSSNTLYIFQKNEMLNTLQEKFDDLAPEVKAQVKPLLQDVRSSINLDKDWGNFQRHFVEVHPYFFTQLKADFPHLSQNDCKILAYIRMKLPSKDIASLLGISIKSVEMSRYRLEKKFNLTAEDNLDRWLEKY